MRQKSLNIYGLKIFQHWYAYGYKSLNSFGSWFHDFMDAVATQMEERFEKHVKKKFPPD